MAGSVPRFLLSNGLLFRRQQFQFLLRRDFLQARQPIQTSRQVTGNAKARSSLGGPRIDESLDHPAISPEERAFVLAEEKAILLEKPDKFRPPSHGRRTKEQIPRNYGQEELTEEQTERVYPRSFPPEGTWTFWILTNDRIHANFALFVLTSLALFVTYENWRKDTIFKSQLPSLRDTFLHPIDSCTQIMGLLRLSVYEETVRAKWHTDHDTTDLLKRNTWRKHHGIEDKQGLGPWMAAEERLRVWKEKRREEGDPVKEWPRGQKKLWMGFDWT